MIQSLMSMVLFVSSLGTATPDPMTHLAPHDPFAAFADRVPVEKPEELFVPPGEHRLVVKFVDGARVRLIDGVLRSETGTDLASIGQALAQKGAAPVFIPLITTPEDVLRDLEADAARRTGVRPIDLRGMFEIVAPADQLKELGEALLPLDTVEWAQLELLSPEPPACADAAPSSGNLINAQGYTQPFTGVNIVGARTRPNARGAGVKYADVEYGANGDHEDLCSIVFEPGTTIPSFVFDNGWDSHGTAVMGILGAGDNGYGMTGLAPDAEPSFFPEWSNGSRRATAITNASAHVGAGGVIVLEMQTIQFGTNYGPAELDFSVWSAVKNATDAGRIVVAAAGNGNQNLDSATYASYSARGDSGAIIIGAGTSGSNRTKLSFSTYGSRVDVQGWGQSVASTGYGSYAVYGGDKNQRYTSSFNGTSSATPVVAGVAIVVQGYAQATYGEQLTSQDMRDILSTTGLSQTGSGGAIGPRPDALEAIGVIDDMFGLFCDADYDRDGDVDLTDFGFFGAAFGSTAVDAHYREDADSDKDGDVDLTDFGAFGSQFGLTSDDCD